MAQNRLIFTKTIIESRTAYSLILANINKPIQQKISEIHELRLPYANIAISNFEAETGSICEPGSGCC